MKKTLILALCALTLVSSCDFVRTLAGRPTSAQLEQIRLQKIQAEEARHQAVLDSMAQAEKALAEALAAREQELLDSLTQAKGTVLNPSRLGGLYTTKLDTKYCIVVGAFRNRSNAERKLAQCNEAGYTATIVSFRNGLLAVSVCPSDNLEQTLKTLKQLRGTDVCPQDGWILMNL
ncbi:MAG: SPOR domain-containing protein [Bacteroidales bacterium]|jgi:cell division protein FtsN|nr:SPOR domain-containing protein [Bacteroidales bacterium]